jgi:uncharacterized protein (UPF0333 family)
VTRFSSYFLLFVFLIVLLILLGSGTYFYRSQFLSKKNTVNTVTLLENNSNCNLQNDLCSLEFSTGEKISFEISPRPIYANQKQKAILKIQHSDWTPESIDFSSEDMGYNRPAFKKIKENVYEADFSLDSCAFDEIKWRTLILLHTKENKRIGIPFYIFVRKE